MEVVEMVVCNTMESMLLVQWAEMMETFSNEWNRNNISLRPYRERASILSDMIPENCNMKYVELGNVGNKFTIYLWYLSVPINV